MDASDLARRLAATPLFAPLPSEALVSLLAHSPHRHWEAGEAVTAPGVRHHVVLLQGALQARRHWADAQGDAQSSQWEVQVSPTSGFALLSHAGNVHAKAVTASEGLLIPADELDEWLEWSGLAPELAVLRHLRVFRDLPPEHLQLALQGMTTVTVQSGENVVTQGEPGDSYYVILHGQAQVWVTDPLSDETALAAVLGDGDAFGEESLLVEGNRTATVTMIAPGQLLRLSKDDFDCLLKPQMVHVIEPAAARSQLTQQQAVLIDCRYDMEFEESRIPGARLVPLGTLRQTGAFELDARQRYIVYCRSGRRSSAAAFLLRERGFDAVSLRGGIKGWPYELDASPM